LIDIVFGCFLGSAMAISSQAPQSAVQQSSKLKPMATVGAMVMAMLALWLSLTPWSKFQGGEGGEAFLATQIKWLNSVAKKTNELPNATCFWQQGSIINNIPTGPSDPDCLFEVLQLLLLSTSGILETQAQGFRYTSSPFNLENS
jgi:hypothetical protein